jgi:hypothetical protein
MQVTQDTKNTNDFKLLYDEHITMFNFVEKEFPNEYRLITVTIKNGKKIPSGENNTYTQEQIKKNRGNGNYCSIYLKYTNICVIDIDEDYDYDKLHA